MKATTRKLNTRTLRRGALLFVLAAAVWAILTHGAPGSWLLGIPAALLYAALLARPSSLALPRLRPAGLARFIAYFAHQSLISGADVARRALAPGRPPLSPAIVDYRTRLPPGAARALFANAISLLPGTLTCGMEGDLLHIHALVNRDVEAALARLEDRIADAFAPAPEGGA